MNTAHSPGPEDSPQPSEDLRFPPLHQDVDRCPCGAVVEAGELCAKCRARAAWDRRRIGRTRGTGTARRIRGADRPAGRREDDTEPRDRTRPRGRRPRH